MSVNGPDLGILGISSGLDTQSLIDKIMAFESQPLVLLNSQISDIRSKENAWNPLRGLFQTLQDAAAKLTQDEGWKPQKASVSDDSLLSATASAGATPGVYTIQADDAYLTAFGVTSPMAQAEQDVSTATSITDPNAALGYTGTFSLNGGDGITLNGSEGLNQIAALINDQSDETHVTASVVSVYDATTDTTHIALQLRSTLTGKDNGITYADSTTSAGGSSLFEGLGILQDAGDSAAQAAAMVQAPQDAHFVVNGVAMVSDSNTISDAIPGVTITLKNLAVGSQATVTLTPDVDGVVRNVRSFVDAFNKLVDTVADDTKYDPATKTGGPLLGNVDLLLLGGRLSNDVQTVVGGAGTFAMLAQVGITQEKDGTLTFDEDAFRAAWNEDPASVQALFRAEGTGVAQLVKDETARWLDDGGILDTQSDAWDDRVKQLQKDVERMSDFLQQRQDMLTREFQAMEDAINRMQGQASSLTALIAQIAANQAAISASRNS